MEYLAHYGILGQKWGVRRFQNEDGTLTEEGRKRYSGEFSNSDYRNLNRQVRKKKKEVSGDGNQFRWSSSSGKYSNAAIAKRKEEWTKAENSKESKDYLLKVRKLERQLDSGKIDQNKYEELFEKANNEYLKTDAYKNLSKYRGERVGNENSDTRRNGYSIAFLENGGKDITVARLRDLGYDEIGANYVANYLIKNGRILS